MAADPRSHIPKSKEVLAHQVSATVGPLHFSINGASITPICSELLEIFAAYELPVLSRKGGELEIKGYADQPHDRFSNLILSRNRAVNTYVFLKNILGPDLATGELEPIPSEAEEQASYRSLKGLAKDEPADPSCEGVRIEGKGETDTNDAHGDGDVYDLRYRRVEVRVNGTLSLLLSRIES